jgi:hypothetical protein
MYIEFKILIILSVFNVVFDFIILLRKKTYLKNNNETNNISLNSYTS